MSRQRKLEVIQQAEDVTIGELVRLTDVRYSTLKFYTEQGMLPFQQAEENLTRRYKREESIRRIQWIKALRQEGKSIQQIKQMLHAQGWEGRGGSKETGAPSTGCPGFFRFRRRGCPAGIDRQPKGSAWGPPLGPPGGAFDSLSHPPGR